MAPDQVREQDEARLWTRIYGDGDTYLKRRRPDLPLDTMVRLSKAKRVFNKRYMPNWTKEHFQVSAAPQGRKGTKRPEYKVKDFDGEEVKGSWYPEELQNISHNQYCIEVLRRRIRTDGRKEKLVR